MAPITYSGSLWDTNSKCTFFPLRSRRTNDLKARLVEWHGNILSLVEVTFLQYSHKVGSHFNTMFYSQCFSYIYRKYSFGHTHTHIYIYVLVYIWTVERFVFFNHTCTGPLLTLTNTPFTYTDFCYESLRIANSLVSVNNSSQLPENVKDPWKGRTFF